MPTLNSTRKAGAMPKRNKERATPDDVADEIVLVRRSTAMRIPKALADRAILDAYERTPSAARFVGLDWRRAS